MKDNTTQSNTSNERPTLARVVLKRIETEKIEPTPRWHFIFSEYSMWTMWVVSVAVGALSVAVTLYVSVHAGYALYEATHESWLEFLVEITPWLWLLIFILMAGVGYFNLRKTERVYRYPVWQILLSSFVISIIGGVILNLFGAGTLVESALQKTMPMYTSLSKLEQQWWQRPQLGLLLGQAVTIDEENESAVFIDIHNNTWELKLGELNQFDVAVLTSGDIVRILGIMSTSSDDIFYGCGVFPWMYKPATRVSDIRKEREAFLRRISELKHKVVNQIENLKEIGAGSTTISIFESVGQCPSMPVVKKMPL